MRTTTTGKVHDRLAIGALLTMAAGGLDAYSFLFHGEVFAGLQTGNLILLGVNLGRGQLATAGHYALSILAFFIGTLIIRSLQHHAWLGTHHQTRRNVVIIYEAVLLLLISLTNTWLPNWAATALLSITAAAELQEFRTLNGKPFTPLMMTGNLRTLAETSFDAVVEHDHAARKRLGTTATIMVTFMLGALAVAVVRPWLHGFALLVPVVVLIGVAVLLQQGNE